jgi:hypothetical protein
MSKLYIIRDVLAGGPAGPLVVLEHDAVAVRMFQEVASEPQSMVSRFLKDHELVCVGEFNRSTCGVDGNDYPKVIMTGEALIAMREMPQAVA